MPDRPTGTVSFLFTDIEGSTKLWEHQHDLMQDAFRRHEAILRAAIAANGGYAYKMIGDAFQAAFQTAPAALAASLDAQHALGGEDWGPIGPIRVRIALHTGVVEERGDDYVGPLLNRVARLLSTGYGGQILLTATTRELVRDSLPPEVSLLDLGEHRLKDLIRPERVFQAVAPGLVESFPSLKSLDTRPNNLPVQRSPLIGREQEVVAVVGLLRRADTGLVTLTGPGGMGKTRLSLQVAAELLDDFPDGVWFVELAPITDPALVTTTLATTLGVKEAADQPLRDSLLAFVRDKRLLLVLDNFEQVVAAAPLVADLLRAAPHLKILVSSRVVLGVYGEQDVRVPPLALPDLQHLPPLEQLTQYEAVRLFIERAQAAKADFQVTTANAPAVAEICHRLDGLPLAIELAAARVRLLPPQALLQRLSSRLQVLTGGARTLPARQQTLRQAIAWSYDLLNDAEQTLFRRLGVFAGGCSMEAAEAVCNPDGELDLDILDGLQALLDQSLLQQVERLAGEARFTMLETIREYALEQLAARGEAPVLQQRHAAYYLALLAEADPHLWAAQQGPWLERLEVEHDNLRAMLGRTWGEGAASGAGMLPGDAAEMGMEVLRALLALWNWRGYLSEGRTWVERALRQTGKEARTRARAVALFMSGTLATFQGDLITVRAQYEESIAIWRELGDKQGLAFALHGLGGVAVNQGDEQAALSILEEARVLLQEVGDKPFYTLTLMRLGDVALAQDNYPTARHRYEGGLAIQHEIGDTWMVAQLLNNLGEVARCEGDYARAKALYEESLAKFRALGTTGEIARSLHNLAYVAHAHGQDEQAATLFGESLRLFQERGNRRGMAECLMGFAAVALMQQQTAGVERAARLLVAAEAQFEAIGAAMWPADRIERARTVAAVRAELSEEAYAAATAAGRAMALEQAVAYAVEETAAFP